MAKARSGRDEYLVQHISGTFTGASKSKLTNEPRIWRLVGERWSLLSDSGSLLFKQQAKPSRSRTRPVHNEWHECYELQQATGTGAQQKDEPRHIDAVDADAALAVRPAEAQCDAAKAQAKAHALLKLYPTGAFGYKRELRILLLAKRRFATAQHYRRHFATFIEAGQFTQIATCINRHLIRNKSVVAQRFGPNMYSLRHSVRYVMVESLSLNIAELWSMSCGAGAAAMASGSGSDGSAREKLLAYRLCIGCMRALRALHILGYVCRAVAPIAFALRTGDLCGLPVEKIEHALVLCDLRFAKPIVASAAAKQSVNAAGGASAAAAAGAQQRPARVHQREPVLGAVVGARYYMSIASHFGVQQTAVDDYIACVYMLLEWLQHALPWSLIGDEHMIVHLKHKLHDKENKRSKLYVVPRHARYLMHKVLERKLMPFDKMERHLHRAIEAEAHKARIELGALPLWLPIAHTATAPTAANAQHNAHGGGD